jgi:hypothetical protein
VTDPSHSYPPNNIPVIHQESYFLTCPTQMEMRNTREHDEFLSLDTSIDMWLKAHNILQ